jgi:hypothetical protein
MTTFMTSFTTTIGYTVYVPTLWDLKDEAHRMVTLSHERIHMRQRQKYGSILFSFLYLLVFFPAGLAYFRAKFEKEAYAESMRAMIRYIPHTTVDTLRNRLVVRSAVKHFTSSQYLWMWPFEKSVEKWYLEEVQKIEDEGV